MQSVLYKNDFFKYFILYVIFVSYCIFSSLYPVLPPLIGVFFAFLLVKIYEIYHKFKKFDSACYFVIIYLFLAEQIHGFSCFSVGIFFLIYYNFLFGWLLKNVKIRNVLIILAVVFAYLGTFAITNLFYYIRNIDLLSFGYEYIIYMIIESIIAMILLKDKIL